MTPTGTKPRWPTTNTFLQIALLVSVAGFLGYYDGIRFIIPPAPLVLGLQVIVLLAALVLHRADLLTFRTGLVPLVLLATWACLTVLWADSPETAGQRWLLIFAPGLLLAALAAADAFPARSFARLKWALVIITIASYVFSLSIYIFGEVIAVGELLRFRVVDLGGWTIGVFEGGRQYLDQTIYIHRFSGFTSNPNSFALFAALATIMLCATIGRPRDTRGYAMAGVFIVILFILVISASRAALAMALAGIVVVTLLRLEQRRLAQLCVFGVLALTCLLYLAAVLQSTGAGGTGAEVFEFRERADIWRLALSAIGNVWATGVGFGLTEEAVFAPLGVPSSGHSVPLSLLLETGIPGLVLLLLTWFWPVFALTRRDRPLDGTSISIVALLIALFVHQSIDSSVFRYHWAHFVFVYLIGASSQLAARRENG